MKILSLIVSLSLILCCTSVPHRDSYSYMPLAMNDQDEDYSYNPAPRSVGIYFVDSWWNKDINSHRNQLLTALDELEDQEVIGEQIWLNDSILVNGTGGEIESIRQAAARYHLDDLLIISSGQSHSQRANFLSFFYISVIGMWIVPGTSYHAEFSYSGTLVNVLTGELYFTANGGSSVDRIGTLVKYDSAIENHAQGDAFHQFCEELQNSFKRNQ